MDNLGLTTSVQAAFAIFLSGNPTFAIPNPKLRIMQRSQQSGRGLKLEHLRH